MTPKEIGAAIRAFRSENCPACGAAKPKRTDPFCGDCWRSLPFELQEDVADDKLFLDSFYPALSYLNANQGSADPAAAESNDVPG